MVSCFLWCHSSHINPAKIHPERVTREDQKLVNSFDYDGVGFPVREKNLSKNNICINVFCYEKRLASPITFQIKNLKTRWICCL